MRRLFLLIIALWILMIYLKRFYKVKRTNELLIEDICQTLQKEYLDHAKDASKEFWLRRLREVRTRYGNEISKGVAKRLETRLKGTKS